MSFLVSYHPTGLKCVWILPPTDNWCPITRVDAAMWTYRIDQLRDLVRQRLEEM